MGSHGKTLTVKIVLAFVGFGLAAVHGAMSGRTSPMVARIEGVAGGVVSATVRLLAAALGPLMSIRAIRPAKSSFPLIKPLPRLRDRQPPCRG